MSERVSDETVAEYIANAGLFPAVTQDIEALARDLRDARRERDEARANRTFPNPLGFTEDEWFGALGTLKDRAENAEAALAAEREQHGLLWRAVNDSTTECAPDCNRWGHSETCPNCDHARWLADQQKALEAAEADAKALAEALRGCRYSCQTQDDCASRPRPCETCRLNREIDPVLAAHDARTRKEESR